jgi:antitoxin component YwqK of YwqJK toxin-antitoxin module
MELESGKLYRESTYVDDEIEGIQKKYYEDGKLMAEIPYKKGKLLVGTRA